MLGRRADLAAHHLIEAGVRPGQIVGLCLPRGADLLVMQAAIAKAGAAWLPFLVAFAVALLTALSYLELVTKYPKAAGAALYVHKAFGVHFLTFIVCFTVMCSGLTSAATASQAFAANLFAAFGIKADKTWITFGALGFMLLVMLVNLRGAAESVKANVVLTLIELSGLLMTKACSWR
ncbi:hypothetical protein G6F31_018265 [Rhizopus arrhizus]|nr:hypothetical protein G6F31_018265 [Rhizopus arrhizus]